MHMRTVRPSEPSTARRRTLLGAGAWIAAVAATFAGQFTAQAAWDSRDAYSWARNNISDLGMESCRTWGPDDRFVCSPWHDVANIGFGLYGLLLVAGVIALMPVLQRGVTGVIAAGLLCLTGLGSALVGAAPADVNGSLHESGAALVFVAGNLAMIAAMPALRRSGMRGVAYLGVTLGVIGLISIPLFLGDAHLGLGRGGIERVVVWSLDVWNVAVAVAVVHRLPRGFDVDSAESVSSRTSTPG